MDIDDIKKLDMLYEGKAKKLFKTDIDGYLIQEFKDDATAGDGEKHDVFAGKGVLNNDISSVFFKYLNENDISTHFVADYDEKSMVVKSLEMIPVEVVVRNIAAGSISRRLGIEEGEQLPQVIVEYYLKDDELHDPMLNRYHIKAFGWLTFEELDEISRDALKVNELLKDFLLQRDLILVDFKLEYGRSDNRFILGDEITPDTCRFWDSKTGDVLDKDVFRRDMGDLLEVYEEILKRISGS